MGLHQIQGGLRPSTMSAPQAQERLNAFIDQGRRKSMGVVQRMVDETQRRRDFMVSRDNMRFEVTPEHVRLAVVTQGNVFPEALPFTSWSETQMFQDLGLPKKVIRDLQAEGKRGASIASEWLNDIRYRIGGQDATNGKATRLMRFVDNTIRAVLSPTYQPFDQLELLEGFRAALQGMQDEVVFTDGTLTEKRYSLTAIFPRLFEAWPGEFVVIGGRLESSDWGGAAGDYMQEVTRLICRNGAVGSVYFHRIHSGKGLGIGDFDGAVEISDKTRSLSAAAIVSALTDAVGSAFTAKAAEKALAAYVAAANREVDVAKISNDLRAEGLLTKDDTEQVKALMGAEVEFLPTTPVVNSAQRLAQMLSWMGNEAERKGDGEKKIGLQMEAGRLMGIAPKIKGRKDAPQGLPLVA